MNTPLPDSSPALETVQRWMLSVMTHPGGIVAGIESSAARAELDVPVQQLEQVISPSVRCTSLERLSIYGNAYFARLLECLEAEFPTVLQAVGAEAFRAFAQGYLQEFPSTSYTLNMLGSNFPAYLARTRPASADQALTQWSDFVVELAELERIYAEVFDGPGEETLPPFSVPFAMQTLSVSEDPVPCDSARQSSEPDGLSPDSTSDSTPVDQWNRLRLTTAASLRLCRFRFPVHESITAARQGKPVTPIPPRETWLVVNRRDYVVRREAVTELQWHLLRAFQQGATLEQAIGQILEDSADSIDALSHDLQAWFQHWAASGYFCRMEMDSPADLPE